MPSLEEILKKTKDKSEQIKIVRKPPSIATEDRPYSFEETVQRQTVETDNKVTTNRQQTDSNLIAEIVSNKPQLKKAFQSQISKTSNKVATNRQQTGDKLIREIVRNPPQSERGFQKQTLETDNKVATNQQQSENKLATVVATNREQTDNKIEPENIKWQQSDNGTGNNIGNKVTTNRQQTGNKVITKTAFSELVGLQRDIVIFICHECKNSRSRITESLTLEHIAISLKRSTGAIKTTIQRLEKKSCLQRIEFKNGRGGWSRYEVPDHIYHDALRSETGNKLTTKREQSDNKVASQLATEPATRASSSSSSLNLKETTTELNDEWNFDITPYIRFGFSISQIRQLANLGVISASEVEQSLIEFSYDLDNNALPLIKTGKVNFLMGLFRSGSSYVSEGFKSEQEAMISEMARRAEGKRKKLLEEKFTAWEMALNDEERKEITDKLPPQLMVLYRTYGINNLEIRAWLFNYYTKSSLNEKNRVN